MAVCFYLLSGFKLGERSKLGDNFKGTNRLEYFLMYHVMVLGNTGNMSTYHYHPWLGSVT
jgi:hypothetical protein